MDWGARHLGGQAMTLTHKSCGATVMPHIACPECGERVEARDMRAVRTDAALRDSPPSRPVSAPSVQEERGEGAGDRRDEEERGQLEHDVDDPARAW